MRKQNRDKVLVTGGAGFIGSNLTERLVRDGYKTAVLDDFSSSGRREFSPPGVHVVRGSFGDSALLMKLLGGVKTVFHLASTGVPQNSIKNPVPFFQNNVQNGIVLLDAMRKSGVRKIVYSSSSGAYGEPERTPIKEGDRKEPVNPYGASKLAFEHALSSYYHAFGIESVSLRYFNVYGPGDRQQPVTRAIPTWVQAALRGEVVPVYWGLSQKKDYVFVQDVVGANIIAAEKGRGATVYNVGSGKGYRMSELYEVLERLLGRALPKKNLGERPGDPSILIADISKIRRELGWRPSTPIEEGMRQTIDFYRRELGSRVTASFQ
jgi:UDP-glucose 4-epimerase